MCLLNKIAKIRKLIKRVPTLNATLVLALCKVLLYFFINKYYIFYFSVKCYYDLSKRLGKALRHEEKRCSYLTEEMKTMVSFC